MSESTAGGAIAKGVIEIDARADGVDATIAKVEGALTELGTAGRQAGAEASAGISQIGTGAESASARVVSSTGRAKRSVEDLGDAGRQAGTGNTLPKLGSDAEGAGRKIDAATRSIVTSIQRQIAMLEAGGKATSSYYEALAQQRGIDPARIKPYLDQLESVSARQQQVGQTSGEMAAAMRTLPAQFTDIATSLASGQDPMLVLIQQGGQLKDQFGGIGPAARAMGQYVLGLINPFTLTAAAVGALVLAHEAGAREMRAYNEAMITTNGAAGVTGDAMADMAARMDEVSGTQSKAAETLAALASTGAVAGQNLESFALSVVGYSKVSGAAIEDLAKNFAALAEDPTDAVLRLDKEMRFLTAGLYEQINALEEQGNKTAAAELAQQSYADLLAKRTAEMAGNLGTIERGWNAIAGATKEALDAMLSIGRQQTIGQQIAKLDAQIASLGESPSRAMVYRSQIEALKVQREALASDQRRLATDEARQAEREQVRKAGVAAAISIEKALDSAASKSEKMQKALAKAGRDFAAAAAAGNPVSAANQDKILADIRKRFAEKQNNRGARLAGQAVDAYGDMERSLRKQLMTEQELTVAEKVRMDLTDKRYKQLSEGQKSTLIGLAKEVDAFKVQQKLFADMAASAKELAAADTRRQQEATDAAYQAYQRVADQVKALQQEADTYGLSAAGVQDYLLAKAEERLALEKSGEVRQGVIEQIEREIAERRKLADLQRGKDMRDAAAEAAQKATENWQKTSDQISQSLTDGLMRGFDNGKDFADNFADMLEASFKTIVLRPVVEFVTKPVSNAINQAFNGQSVTGGQSIWSGSGFGGNVAGGIGSLLNQFGNLSGSAGLSAYGAGYGLSASEVAAAAEAYRSAGMNDIAGQLQSGQSAASTIGQYAQAAGYVMAAYNGIKAIEDGRWGSAAGTAIGAWFGGPLGASIGGQVGGMVDDMFGGGGGPKTGGEGWTGSQRDEFYTPGESDRQLRDTVRQLQAQYIGMAVSLGGSAKGLQFGLGFDSDPQGNAGDRVKSALYGADGRSIYSVLDRGVTSAQEGVKVEASRLLVAALQQSDLPIALAKVLSSIDVATASEESLQAALDRVQTIGKIETAFRQLATVFPTLSGLTLEAKERMAELSGGVDNLTSNLGAYYAAFVPEEERRAAVMSEIAAELSKVNLQLPASRDEFRQLATSLQATGQASTEAFAKLMGVAGAFASVTEQASGLSDYSSRVEQAYDRESSAKAALIDRLASYADSLRDMRHSLQLGELSTLSPEQKYQQAKRLFDETRSQALAGDQSAQDKLSGIAQQYLEASRAYNASAAAYAEDFATVQAALLTAESSARAQISLEQQSLTAMQRMVDGIVDLKDEVESLADAVKAYYAAKSGSSGGTGAPVTGGSTSGGLQYDPSAGTVNGAGFGKLGYEAPANLVYQAFEQILGRSTAGDVAGADFWEQQIKSGKYGVGDIDTDRFIKDFIGGASGADKTAAETWLKRQLIDGSHRDGLKKVGKDGYIAELHYGEGVLTAEQNRTIQSIDWRAFGRVDNTVLVAEVKALRAEVAALRTENAADAAASRLQAEAVARVQLTQSSKLSTSLDRAVAERI